MRAFLEKRSKSLASVLSEAAIVAFTAQSPVVFLGGPTHTAQTAGGARLPAVRLLQGAQLVRALAARWPMRVFVCSHTSNTDTQA